MCGIAGVIGKEIDLETRQIFNSAFTCLKHRGPQGSNTTEFAFPGSKRPNFIFGHHRLAIVDLNERANQPLVSKRGSALIINGEIYNASKLREELSNKYEFITTSDSEVALATLETYGLNGVAKLDGMFAFAFYPAGESSVWIGRDRLGIKPLYFTREKEKIWFSSEARPLARALNRNLDEIGISEWVQYQFQVSHRTFFRDVFSVPAGSVLTIKDGVVKTRQYWNLEDHLSNNNQIFTSVEDAVNTLRELLSSSVKRHLISDVEVATIASGGMDSSSISVLAAGLGVKECFVGRYLESGYDESSYANAVARFAKLNITHIDIYQGSFFDVLQQASVALDYPTAGPGSIGQYLVAKEIAKTHRVVLSGTGGDELFLGYVRDRFALWAAAARSDNSKFDESLHPTAIQGYEQLFKKFIEGGGFESPISGFMAILERGKNNNPLLSISEQRKIAITAELRAFISPNGGESLQEVHDSLIRYEVSRFLPSLLQVEDRVTMAHGLESRVPFLDLELVEFLLAIPYSVRMAGNTPKDLLRMAMCKKLPTEVLERRDKMGFPVPFMEWSKSPNYKKTVDNLVDSLKEREIPGLIVNHIGTHGSASHLDARELWGVIAIETWLRGLD